MVMNSGEGLKKKKGEWRENGAHDFPLRIALMNPIFPLRETVELPRGRRCLSRPRVKSALIGSSKLGLERAPGLNRACGTRPCPCACPCPCPPCPCPWLDADPGGDGDSDGSDGEGEGDGDGDSWLRISSDLRFPRVASRSRTFSHASAAADLGALELEGTGMGMGAASSSARFEDGGETVGRLGSGRCCCCCCCILIPMGWANGGGGIGRVGEGGEGFFGGGGGGESSLLGTGGGVGRGSDSSNALIAAIVIVGLRSFRARTFASESLLLPSVVLRAPLVPLESPHSFQSEARKTPCRRAESSSCGETTSLCGRHMALPLWLRRIRMRWAGLAVFSWLLCAGGGVPLAVCGRGVLERVGPGSFGVSG